MPGAVPPPLPPATRTNATPEIDSHPTDHNQLVAAIAALQTLGIVVPATNFAQSGALATAPAWTSLGSVSWPGVAGRTYRVSGWWGFSSGSAPATIQSQLLDVTPATTIGLPAITVQSFWYGALPVIAFIKCGAANRAITITMRSDATSASTGAKAEIGYLGVEDVGRDAT